MIDYIFIIYSCQKNIKKASLFYNCVNKRLKNTKCYIILGDNSIKDDYEIVEDKYIALRCGDNYENLSDKTKSLFATIEKIHSRVKGVIKCDDDMIPNTNRLNELLDFINSHNDRIDYLGNINHIPKDTYSTWHYNKTSTPEYDIPVLVKKCSFATGPMYYLSRKAIRLFNNCKKETDIFCEDVMVGYYLHTQNICIVHLPTYNDSFCYELNSYENTDEKQKNLFVFLHGGLGNQLFQLASAYGISKKHCMNLVLLYDNNYRRTMTHNKTADEFFSTIFNYFNYTCIENIDFTDVNVYTEPNCFHYDDSIIKERKDYLLTGYFQNQKYFKDYKNELIEILKNDGISNNLLQEYPQLKESYFIHIRRGDYVKHPLYEFDRDTYFRKAIDYILEKENDAHFFIVSDDIEYCKTYDVLDSIKKTFVNMETLDTLYFMANCAKGGICSNSSFSGWGTLLNPNEKKIVVLPKQWINVEYEYEIPFENTILL